MKSTDRRTFLKKSSQAGIISLLAWSLPEHIFGMKIATIAPLRYTPGKLEYFQFIRGGIGADYHQGPGFIQFPEGEVRMIWSAYDYDECSPNGVLLYSDSKDRGITWSNPQVYLADFMAGAIGGPLLLLRDNKTALAVMCRTSHKIEIDEKQRIATKGSDYFEARTQVFIRRSTDGAGPLTMVRKYLISSSPGAKACRGAACTMVMWVFFN